MINNICKKNTRLLKNKYSRALAEFVDAIRLTLDDVKESPEWMQIECWSDHLKIPAELSFVVDCMLTARAAELKQTGGTDPMLTDPHLLALTYRGSLCIHDLVHDSLPLLAQLMRRVNVGIADALGMMITLHSLHYHE